VFGKRGLRVVSYVVFVLGCVSATATAVADTIPSQYGYIALGVGTVCMALSDSIRTQVKG